MVLRGACLLGLGSVLAVVLALEAAGCGGGNTPPAHPATAPEAGAETFGEVNPADLAELDAGSGGGGGGGGGAAGAADAAAGAPASSGAASPPESDECTPVGIEFEKRARPQLKACYAEGKKKDPNLMGTVRISIDINTVGKVKAIKITEKTLPDPVAQCMLKVVKATPFTDSPKCAGRSLTIPVTFPTPH